MMTCIAMTVIVKPTTFCDWVHDVTLLTSSLKFLGSKSEFWARTDRSKHPKIITTMRILGSLLILIPSSTARRRKFHDFQRRV